MKNEGSNNNLIYIFAFLTQLVNFLTRRGLGVILPMIAKILTVPASSLVFIQSFFGLSRTIICLSSGPWFDKNPKKILLLGGCVQVVSVLCAIFFISNYYLFITSLFFLALGYSIVSLSLWNLLVRSKGFGKTYDVMWLSIAISIGPILMFFLVSLFKTSTVISILIIYSILLTICISGLLYFLKEIDVQPGIDTTYKLQYSNFFNFSIIRNVVILTGSVMADAVLIMFTVFMISLGYSHLQAASYVIFIYSLSTLASRFIFSWVGYNYGTRFAILSGMIISGVGCMFCMVPTNINLIIGLMILGIGNGSSSMNIFSFLADRYGRKNYFSVYSIFAIYGGIFEAICIWTIGLILSLTKQYQMVFLFLSVFSFICVIIQATDKKVVYEDKINGVKEIL